MNKTTTL